MRRWLLPHPSQVTTLLVAQGGVVVEGMGAFVAWADGDLTEEADVRSMEHRADKARRAVQREVRSAFVSEVSPEDGFELSERLDDIMNAVKNLVREAGLLAMPPDQPICDMAHLTAEGVHDLVEALSNLGHPEQAIAAADAAIKTQRKIEHVYRKAMSDLLAMDDFREVTGRRELYRRCVRIGDRIDALADRIWYVVVKER